MSKPKTLAHTSRHRCRNFLRHRFSFQISIRRSRFAANVADRRFRRPSGILAYMTGPKSHGSDHSGNQRGRRWDRERRKDVIESGGGRLNQMFDCKFLRHTSKASMYMMTNHKINENNKTLGRQSRSRDDQRNTIDDTRGGRATSLRLRYRKMTSYPIEI